MGYITKEYLATQFTNFATRIATVFAKKTEIPTKVSELTNDSGFIKNDADDLTNYYKKTEVYTKSETAALVSGGSVALTFDTKDDLDTWMATSTNVATLVVGQSIYIKAKDTPDYWWDGSALQELETEKVDLSGYVKSDDLTTTLADYVKTSDEETGNIDFSTYFA